MKHKISPILREYMSCVACKKKLRDDDEIYMYMYVYRKNLCEHNNERINVAIVWKCK